MRAEPNSSTIGGLNLNNNRGIVGDYYLWQSLESHIFSVQNSRVNYFIVFRWESMIVQCIWKIIFIPERIATGPDKVQFTWHNCNRLVRNGVYWKYKQLSRKNAVPLNLLQLHNEDSEEPQAVNIPSKGCVWNKKATSLVGESNPSTVG